MPRIGLICGLAFVVACGDDGPTGPTTPAELDPEVTAFVAAMNSHRVAEGCGALEWNVDVAGVATAHSQDMVDRSFFSHTNPDGDGPGDRLLDAGIDFSGWAENIAAGQTTGQQVLDAWLNSSGHRANIETCSLTHHGVGLVESRWTHVFLRP
jgi:uncharacterized protein YkwD